MPTGYITTAKAAERFGSSTVRMTQLCDSVGM